MTRGMLIKVQKEKLNVGYLIDKLTACSERREEVGAVATFIGRVRGSDAKGKVNELFLEHYPEMTEKKIIEIVQNAKKKWAIKGCVVVHRIGKLIPGDLSVFVGVTSIHRKEAVEACTYIMDFLKTEAPFWKKETGPLGEKWICSTDSDYIARDQWQAK